MTIMRRLIRKEWAYLLNFVTKVVAVCEAPHMTDQHETLISLCCSIFTRMRILYYAR